MDQDAATPGRSGAVEPTSAMRCELCVALRDDPIHQPVYGAGFFATTIADESLPWQPDWIAPHHPFREPPPSTATRVASDIVAHDLDLEPLRLESAHPGWAGNDLAEIATDTAEHFPADSDIHPTSQKQPRIARRRTATWLTSMFLFLAVATVASASTQNDIVATEEQIASVEAERIEAAAQLDEARDRLGQAQALVTQLSADADATELAALRSFEQARRSAAAVYPEALGASEEFQNALNSASVQDAAVSAAYSTAIAEHDEEAAAAAQVAATETESALVRAAAGVVAQQAIIRDLEMRILALDQQLAGAQLELYGVRKAAQRRLGINDATEQWRPLVAEYFPQSVVDDALWVMWCESRGDPEARAFPKSSAAGLFQFIDSTWRTVAPRAGLAGADRTDPEANIAAAAWLWEASGGTRYPSGAWGPWSCRP